MAASEFLSSCKLTSRAQEGDFFDFIEPRARAAAVLVGKCLEPKQKAFGSVLLKHALPTNSPPVFDYGPEGLTYEVKAELEMMPNDGS